MEPNVWRKSSRSGSNGQCTEVKDTGVDVLVRDSKNPSGSVLAFTRDEWRAFVDGVRAGEFDITN
ncbi:DUF397 domain-containing protein [Micromonospora chalcea]|uniref:DUF397 domain-containing protein n=1 Tax=Micromonospora chalcea TaxID=1874 RepID=UPI0021A65A6D|nr:DUF397 domain-containing protein [Micromonospora chalcea]MCT2282359.1 DUF397 domain-containing protein [Micromonospora chalcea]